MKTENIFKFMFLLIAKKNYMINNTDLDACILHVYTLDKLNSSTELKTIHAYLEITFNFNSRIVGNGVA